MHIDVTMTPAELERTPLAGKTVIVIDVLRATTTIVTALENGAAGVLPVGEVENARSLVAQWSTAAPGWESLTDLKGEEEGAPTRPLLAGERGAQPPPGFDLGNSPLAVTSDVVGGRAIVLTTSNGTQALEKAAGAAEVRVCCLRNARATARVCLEGERDIVIACAGTNGRLSLEDVACAAYVMDVLEECAPEQGALTWGDGARLVRGWFRHIGQPTSRPAHVQAWQDLLRGTRHGRHLMSLGFGDDLTFCAEVDVSEQVPRSQNGWLVPDAIRQDFPTQSRS